MELQEALQRGRKVVFLDIAMNNEFIGRIKLELFNDIVPRTAENFRQLCTGEMIQNNRPVGYKGSIFHRIIRGFMIQGGDFVNGDGSGSTSIYGPTFSDENFQVLHSRAGLLSSANTGPNSNGCQFFITCAATQWLDGKHVVFGQVLDHASLLVVKRIESVQVDPATNKPTRTKVEIIQCGEL